ncbi:MAG: hypothetical protein IPJ69_09700 [Deltaproteobacteria bacterium]|nr:MAG: hypothetical protein IPJ69_09700 [Deltaproteobacteria bacterium]
MIGEGDIPGSDAATGGIPLNALDPSHGEKFVQYQIGTNQPVDPISIGSIPYAMWAEKSFGVVNDAIGSDEIKNGTIKAEDLEAGSVKFSDIGGLIGNTQLPVDVVHLSELEAHKNDPRAHRSEQIQFTYLPGTTYLPPSSSSILSLQAVISSLYDSVNFVRTRLVSSMNEHSVQDIATAHPNGNFPAGRISGPIITSQIADRAITAEKLAAGVVGADSIADGTIGSSKITDESITSADIQNGTIQVEDIFRDETDSRSLDNRFLNEAGDSMTCSILNSDGSCLNVGGNISVSGTVDNVDVSDLDQVVRSSPSPRINHETRITRIESRFNASGQISDAQIPQSMKPFAFASFHGIETEGTRAGQPRLPTSLKNISTIERTIELGGTCPLEGGIRTGREYRIYFATASPDTDYIVMITGTNGNLTDVSVINKQTDYFDTCDGSAVVGGNGSFDVLIYHVDF